MDLLYEQTFEIFRAPRDGRMHIFLFFFFTAGLKNLDGERECVGGRVNEKA